MSGSNTAKIVIAVVAMGVAVTVSVYSFSSEEQPRVLEGAQPIHYTCESCQHQFEMTPQDLLSARNLIKHERVAERGTRFSVRRELAPCKACNEVTAVRSARRDGDSGSQPAVETRRRSAVDGRPAIQAAQIRAQ